MESLNNNPNYHESAKKWEGELILEFLPDGNKLKEPTYLWLDIYHGEVKAVEFISDKSLKPYKYTIVSEEVNWRMLFQGALDPTKALMSGKFRIKGDFAKLMRFLGAAGYIMKYLSRHLSEW